MIITTMVVGDIGTSAFWASCRLVLADREEDGVVAKQKGRFSKQNIQNDRDGVKKELTSRRGNQCSQQYAPCPLEEPGTKRMTVS